MYDYISGFHRENEDGSTTLENGRLPLFRNFDEHGNPLGRPRTLLIDSEQLESGDALDKNFHDMASDEIDRFRREIIERTGDRRQAYDLNEENLFNVEYADVLGIPFDFTAEPVVATARKPERNDENPFLLSLEERAFFVQLLLLHDQVLPLLIHHLGQFDAGRAMGVAESCVLVNLRRRNGSRQTTDSSTTPG